MLINSTSLFPVSLGKKTLNGCPCFSG